MTAESVTPDLPAEWLVESILRFHAARNSEELHRQLQSVLASSFQVAHFSILTQSGDDFALAFSSSNDALAHRLNPPIVDGKEFAGAYVKLKSANEAGVVPEGVNLSIDNKPCVVFGSWLLIDGPKGQVHVLFHDRSEYEQLLETRPEWVDAIRIHVSMIYSRIEHQSRADREVDLMRGQLDAINGIGELLGSLDLEVLLTRLLELSLFLVSGQVGSIVLASTSEVGEYDCPIEWGLPLEMASCLQTRQDVPIFQSVIESGDPIAACEFDGEADFHVVGADVYVESYLCVPLVSKKRVLGAVSLVNCSWNETDREILMTICGLASTSIENALLYQESIENERHQENLKIARDIQQRLYPASPPQLSWLDIASKTDPCDETGGDYFDFIAGEHDSKLTVVIGDVSGHGIGAALHMVAARSGLRANLVQGRELPQALGSLGDQLEADMEIEHFMTMAVTHFDHESSTVTYVNAGHDAPCIYRVATDDVEEFESTGMPLGLFPGQPYGLGETSRLEPGDVFLAMTDGVWEVNGLEGDMLGKDRMAEIFLELCRSNRDAEAIATGILDKVAEFTGGSPPRDDVTLVVAIAR